MHVNAIVADADRDRFEQEADAADMPIVWFDGPHMTAPQAVILRNGLVDLMLRYPAELARLARWPGASFGHTEGDLRRMIHGIGRSAAFAPAVIWEEEIWGAAVRNCEALEKEPLESDDFREGDQWWFFRSRGFRLDDGAERTFALDRPCIFEGVIKFQCFAVNREMREKLEKYRGIGPFDPAKLSRRRSMLWVALFSPLDVKPGAPPLDVMPRLRFGPAVPEGEPSVATAQFMAAMRFLRLPFIEQKQEPPYVSRQQRRAAERKGEVNPGSVITVTLRRPPKKDRPAGMTEEEHHREYHCRWIRSGGWCRRTIPRECVYYRGPALCGPEDKPLKAPRERVFVARR